MLPPADGGWQCMLLLQPRATRREYWLNWRATQKQPGFWSAVYSLALPWALILLELQGQAANPNLEGTWGAWAGMRARQVRRTGADFCTVCRCTCLCCFVLWLWLFSLFIGTLLRCLLPDSMPKLSRLHVQPHLNSRRSNRGSAEQPQRAPQCILEILRVLGCLRAI